MTRFSLRSQLLAFTLGITILILSGVGWLTYRAARTTLDLEGERFVAELVRGAAGTLDPAFIRTTSDRQSRPTRVRAQHGAACWCDGVGRDSRVG